MKFYQLTTNYATLLNEANVLNVSEPFDEPNSIKSYLGDYASHITSPQLKKMFVKKLTKLLLNDESYHFAVRDLPPNAPDWAANALAQHELVKFVPNPVLDDEIQHISHYVIAMDNDTKSNDNNVKVGAEREISGFNKTESIKLMATKSQEYFKRGGKSQKSDEGMKEILDVGNGFRWLLLQTPEAYRLAGKVLQNCIGSYWSFEKSKKQNASIIVLKKGNGELAVAARIENATNTVDEMKGKNNKPPVDKYMHAVIQFLNKHPKLTLSDGAARDFSNAGYFSIKGKLYDRVTAISTFLQPKKIFKFDDGRTVTVLDVTEVDSSELVNSIYRSSGLEALKGDYVRPPEYICEMIGLGKHYFAAVTPQHELTDFSVKPLQSTVTESTNAGDVDDNFKEFVKVLSQHGIVKTISGSLGKKLLWDLNTVISNDGDLGQVTPVEKIDHDEDSHTWDVHSNPNITKTFLDNMNNSTIHNSIATANIRNSMSHINPDDVDHVYTTMSANNDDTNSRIVVPHTKDGKLHPVNITDSKLDNVRIGHKTKRSVHRTTPSDQLIDSDKIQTIINLANTRHGTLPDNFTHEYGIVKNDEGKYEIYKADMKDVDTNHSKVDLTSMGTQDRLNALSAISRDTTVRDKAHQWHELRDDDMYQHSSDLRSTDVSDYATSNTLKKGVNKYMRSSTSNAGVSNVDWNKTPEEVANHMYRSVPDAAHKLRVSYGSNDQKLDVLIVTSGNKIVKVDDHTGTHELQNWGDHEKVVTQINDFADKHKLSFDSKSINNKHDFTVVNGKLQTVAQKQTDQLKKMADTGKTGKETVDSLPFGDGHKLERMSSEEQTKWLRKDVNLKTADGQAWKLTDQLGDSVAIVTVKDDKVKNIYTQHPERDRYKRMKHGSNVVNKAKSHKADGYVVGAARALGWDVSDTKQFIVKPDSPAHKKLQSVYTNPNKYKYSQSATDKDAVNKGLISRVTARGSRIRYALTGEGKQALRNLSNGMNYNVRQGTSGRAVDSSFVVPERPPTPVVSPQPKSAPTTSLQPRTGSKRAQALELFQQQTRDLGNMPTRGDFIRSLMAEPFNMSSAGASTYHNQTKKKYSEMNEEFSHIAAYEIMIENKAKSFSQFLIQEYRG